MMLFGWVPGDPHADTARVLTAMRRALVASPRQRSALWCDAGFGVGAIDLAPLDREAPSSLEPARHGDRFVLWMVGEAFAWPSHGGVTAAESRTIDFRQALLDAFLRDGRDALRDLDGEYQVAVWDCRMRGLMLLNDRFGALPLYWMRTREGVAFGGGVRGVLLAPGAPVEPDREAIREAVTFGGYRLGTRTNVRDVAMLAGASELTTNGSSVGLERYWKWTDVPSLPLHPVDDVIAELRGRWQSAIASRLAGAGRVGLTLSGGLDSRAILAEAVRHGPVHAVTYGVPESDDVGLARRAARAAGAEWTLHPLYSGRNPSWLERRESSVQATDGLMDLVDLMHVEATETLVAAADLDLSGYIGDAVTGPTFNGVTTAEQVLGALPYYGGPLGMPWERALERASTLVRGLADAPARFALFEHKLPQSTNRVTAALRPYIRVRRPFVAYGVFELAQGQAEIIRGEKALHARWLRTTYPACFARIPHQKTGVPPLASEWRRQLTRMTRYAWRAGLTALAGAGAPVVVPRRSFLADEVYWRTPDARDRIEGTILRSDSIAADIFGRDALRQVVEDWFDRLAGPTQVIGSLFVYESYHRDLARTLRQARAAADAELCSSGLGSGGRMGVMR